MRELETERLRLRALRPDDVQAIYDGWASDPEVTRYLTWNPHESTEQTQSIMDYWLAEYEKEDCFRYGIERKEDRMLMGMLDVVGFVDGAPVIGYCSGRAYWNQGYMTEDMLGPDYFRWLYTALTRARTRVYFVNWKDEQVLE